MDAPLDISKMNLDMVRGLLPRPGVGREFGDLGRLAIIGGSYLNMNPPMISALTAAKLSLDSIYLVIPERHARIRGFPSISISPIFMPDFKITKGVVNKIIKYVKRRRINADVFHIGPGMAGYKKYVSKLIEELSSFEGSLLLLDSGSLYPEVLDLELDWNRIIISPHEGELKQFLGVENISLDDVGGFSNGRYRVVAKLLDGIYFFDKNINPSYHFRYSTIQPTRYGSLYVYTGLLSGFLAYTHDIEKAVVLSQYTFMKTLENISENVCLHWEIEDLISGVKDTLKLLCLSN
ncbi:MAG TPA: hypothetical protein EYH44_02930 [Thermoprotei archaeon]|nr:hypothetical protein [Thermoprotei archaeon]